jgi:hypothetical protein
MRGIICWQEFREKYLNEPRIIRYLFATINEMSLQKKRFPAICREPSIVERHVYVPLSG